MPTVLYLIVLGALGLAFGSFANVVIWRFPRGESLSHPPSACPRCGAPIKWYDNIPVVSWVILRARCRGCGEPISARYPTVELLGGVLWVLAGLWWGQTPQALAAIVLFYLLLILAFIDLDTMRLPNAIVGVLGGFGLVAAVVSQFTLVKLTPIATVAGGILTAPLAAALAGIVLGAGVSLAIALAYAALRKAEGFGMGDVKLLAAMGPFLGPFTLLVLFFGSLLGAVYGIFAARATGLTMRTKVPFGPFLALAAVGVAVAGPALWTWYLSLVVGR